MLTPTISKQQVADPDSKGAQKKAAKKAEAKAKKSASKEDGVTEAGAPGKVDAPAVVIPKCKLVM